jgi:hypothetical protein
MKKFLIAIALMPVGYVLGILLAFGIVDVVGLMSVPTQIAATTQPTVRKIDNAPRTQIASTDQNVGSEQKPSAPPTVKPTPPDPPSPSRNGVIPMPPSSGGFDGLANVTHPVLTFCSNQYGRVVPCGSELRVVPSTE